MRPVFRLAGPLVLLAALASGPALAVPIGVRARTQVTLEHHREGPALVLAGRLVDDQADPIAGENATLEIPGKDPETRLTDSDGRFLVKVSAAELTRLEGMHGQRLPWTVRFEGSARLGSATADGVLDLSKSPSHLEVRIPEPEVVRDDRNIAIDLALTGQRGATPEPIADAEVRLKIGDGKELVGKTGATGRANFVLRPTLLAGAGSYAVVARYLGNNLYAGSDGRAELRVLLPTRLNLRIAREGDEHQGRYRFSGRLSDENGPITHATVLVRAMPAPRQLPRRGSRPVPTPPPSSPVFEALAATNDDGIYVAAVPAQTLIEHGEQVVVISARYVPSADDPRHRGSASKSVNLDIPPAPGISLGWYALGLGLVALLAAFAHALRTRLFAKTWAQLVLAWRAFKLRLRRPLPAAPPPASEPAFVTRVDDGDATRVRASDVFAGVVIDAHKRLPIAATVHAKSSAGHEQHLAVGLDGRFRLGPLPAGAWVVRVEAKGYLARELAVALPHGGDYDGALYALVAVKRRMRELFSDATHALGAQVAWGYDTPREAARRALQRSPSPLVAGLPMGELTTLVERAHFAPDGVGEDEVERARVLREELG